MSTPPMNTIEPEKGRRLALIVGVNHAPASLLPPLEHAVADAEAMAETLQQHCHFQLWEPPLLDEQATSGKVKAAVLDFAEDRTNEDFLLLYFSGHGLPMRIEADRQDVYLVTSDFRPRDVERDENLHFSVRWLRDKLYAPTKAGRVLLILDCCYAGDIGRTAPDPYLEELHRRISYYFEGPSRESGGHQGGQRLALTATGHGATATEKAGYGLMTGRLLPALRGEVDEALDDDGQVSLQRLFEYLQHAMPPEQQPSLVADFAGRSCILAHYPERVAALRNKRPVVRDRPQNYIPFLHDPLFQPRPGEFERLETLLFKSGGGQKSTRLGLVGVVGMGGIGKTQLAVELAYRCLDQHRFSSGIFWTPATGSSLFDWQRWLAELATKTDYLLPDDDPSNPENEARRARHLCRYLASHEDALLVLDNVEDPTLVTSALPALAGGELACTILYTSRNRQAPSGITTYPVELLSEEAALRLLLETTRPSLLPEVLAGSQSTDAQAAREICRATGYLPLTLVMLRGLLEQDQQASLEQLNEALKQPGVLDAEKKTWASDLALLSATFRLSWGQVRDGRAQRLFKLAAYFPEVTLIPLWLLGLAAGLGESCRILNPLWQARTDLQKLSLMEVLIGDQVRLHPLIREFGRQLIAEDGEQGKVFLAEAAKNIAPEFTNVNKLESRAQRKSYWNCLTDTRVARNYVELLGREISQAEQLRQVERCLSRESYLLGDKRWWPGRIPGLFYQQLTNRSVEEGLHLRVEKTSAQWLKLTAPTGAEDCSLLRTFAVHIGAVNSVAFSSDGRLILTGAEDGTVRLWEAGTGALLASFEGHMGAVNSVTFSPDSKLILAGFDGGACLWEIRSGTQLTNFEGRARAVNSVAFSPDSKLMLIGASFDVRLWEVESRTQLTSFEGHTGAVNSVAFSPNSKLVLTGAEDTTARLWEARSGTLLSAKYHSVPVKSVAFSPDGKLVLTGTGYAFVHLWETESETELVTLEEEAGRWANSVAFSPDGKLVLAGFDDGTARLWEVESRTQLTSFEGHSGSVRSVAFSPDSKLALTGAEDGTARLWEVESRIRESAHKRTCASEMRSRKPILTPDAQIIDWRETMRTRLASFEGHMGAVTSVAFSPDGKLVLTGAEDGTACLWEARSGTLFSTLQQKYRSSVKSVAFSPGGKLVLTGAGGEPPNINTAGMSSYTIFMLFDPAWGGPWDGGEGIVCLWEVESGTLRTSFEGHSGWVRSVAFSPDSKLVLTGARHEARLWEVESRTQLASFEGHSGSVRSVAFSPDSKLALTGAEDGTARLWEAGTGALLASFEGHMGAVNSVTFSPDSKLILAGFDGGACLWEIRSRTQLTNFEGQARAVNSVAFSPDGRLLITCDSHGQVLLFCASGADRGSLQGIYVATYEVGAVHWQDTSHMVFADMGGPQCRPHFYRLELEGNQWRV